MIKDAQFHRLRSLVDSLPSMLAYWDRDLICRFANRAYEHWFGVDPDALVGTSLQALLGPELFALNEPYARRALAGEEQTFERFVPGPGGHGRHSLASYIPDMVDGQVAGVIVHVTEVKRLAEAEIALRAEVAAHARVNELLRKSEESLRQAQRLGRIGSWEWEQAADIVTWSEELYRLFGCDPLRLPPSYAQHPTLYSAESWARLKSAVERACTTGEPYVLDLQYVRPDDCGSGWLEARGEAVRDDAGRIVGLRGTAQEIARPGDLRRASLTAALGPPASPALQPARRDESFLRGGGAMGERIRSHDWSRTSLGPPARWAAPLKTVLGILLGTEHPMFVFWGPQHLCFYNDAYSRSLGPEKHDVMLGAQGADVWSEIWSSIGPQIDQVMNGLGPTWHENQLLPIVRNGRLDDAYWTYSYSPIHDESSSSGVGGVLVVCTETTEQVLTERRQKLLVQLDEELLSSSNPHRVVARVTEALGRHLGVARAAYGNVSADDKHIVVQTHHADGLTPIAGTFAIDALGETRLARLRQGQTVVCEEEFATSFGAADAGVRGSVCVPSLRDGRLAAILFVSDRRRRCWKDADVVLIETLARRIGDFVERSRVEAQLRAMFDDAALPMSLTLVDGPYTQVNRAYCEMLGYSHEELLGKSSLDLAHADDREAAEAGRRRLVAGEISRFRMEKRYIHKDGHVIWCDTNVAIITEAGGAVAGFLSQVQNITERRHMQSQMRLAAQRFEVALKSSPVAVFNQDRDLRYTWIYNPQLGYHADAVIGRRDSDLFERSRDAAATEALKTEVMRSGQSRREVVRIEQGGVDRHYDLQVDPLRDDAEEIVGVTCAAVDITNRLAIEQELRAERKRLGLALKAGQMGVYENELATDAVWWSPEMYPLFGVDPEAFVPTRESFLSIVHPDDRQPFLESIDRRFAEGQGFSSDYRILRPDGSLRWIGSRAQPLLDAKGAIVGQVGVALDLTSTKAIEEALREADRHKDGFIAAVAHELRNPIAPIANVGTILQTRSLTPERQRSCGDVISRQTAQLARLLDDLLDVSRVRFGKVRLQRTLLDVATVVQRAVEMAQGAIAAQQHAFDVAMPAQGLRVSGDPARLAQVICNLLTNAAKYTPPRGRLSLAVAEDGPDLVIRVLDDGVGIAAADLHRIFELFGQVEDVQGRSQGGLGIGLALAKSLVEMHGGSIEAHSAGLGRGSEFVVRLPLSMPALG